MMFRKILVGACVAGAAVMVSPALAGECTGCQKVADSGDGFCCGKGIAFGVKYASEKLHAALSGMKLAADKIECPGCKTAVKDNGVCSHCSVGAAKGKFYHSMVAYRLAKGTPVSPDKKIACPSCAKAAKDQGFCTACNAGFVAGRVYKTQDDYKAALAAHTTLAKAAETSKHCETCAVAMVTDGSCKMCKATFKDGEKIGK